MTPEAYRILLVEDSPTSQRMLRQALGKVERFDLVVDAVATLEDALKSAKDGRYDLIFMDYELPDGDGIQAIDNLRGSGVDDPIVMLTGEGDEETAAQAIRSGADDYLTKDGSSPQRIVQTARNQLRIRDLGRQAEFLARHRGRDGQPAPERLALLGAFGSTIQEGLSLGMTDLLSIHDRLEDRIRDLQDGPAGEEADRELAQLRGLVDDLGDTLDRLDRLDGTLQSLRRLTLTGTERSTVDLDDLVTRVVEICDARANIDLETDLAGPEAIDLDAPAIRQTVIHLINNALQSTRDGGTVTVSTQVDGDDAVIEVGDTGPGIPPEVQDRVFDLYVSTKEDHEGLGLPLVRSIVQGHGGAVTHRERAGGGTVFSVRLPMAASDDDT